MDILVVCVVALLASGLTFFSGFGLGTLLLPAFALFMPLEQAVAATAVVHLLNGLFKLGLLYRHIDRGVLLRFGLPAVATALFGAWLLSALGALPPLYAYTAFGHAFAIAPIKLTIGLLLLCFALVEIVPALRDLEFDRRWLPLGGALSGFFGGLSGMQGALRSAFLARSGLEKQAFVATGSAISTVIDLSRLIVYATTLVAVFGSLDHRLLACAVLAAFAGAWIGNRLLKKTTLRVLQRVIAAMLFVFALGLIAGAL
jgi:uncharacterized membrane protein YfcA